MAATGKIKLYLCQFMFLCVMGDVFDRVLDDVSPCLDTCQKTYAPHTYEKNSQADCCRRGCRLFSIMEFIYEPNFNLTRDVCISSCKEAYPQEGDFDACSMGCTSQVPFAVRHAEQEADEEPNIHLLSPLFYMHGLYNNMMDKVYHRMSVSWSFYMQSDGNGHTIVIQSQPQFVQFSGDSEENVENSDEDDYKTSNYLETNIEPLDGAATPIIRNSQLLRRDTDFAVDENDDDNLSGDWLSCVAKKTGIPRLVLSCLLLSCAIVMIWLCLTAAVTAPDRRVPKYDKLSINGDLEYLKQMEALGLKPTFPQDRVDARPLPVKICVERI